MRITKLGHSCLYIEEAGTRILIDPGSFCFMDTGFKVEDLPECDVLLLTHEHQDHTHLPAVEAVVAKSKPVIITNAGVQKILGEHNIESEVLARGEEKKVGNISIGGIGVRGIACDHAVIAPHITPVENIGFMVAGRLFHPGDCIAPSEPVSCEILAAPVAAPWMKVSEGLGFIKQVKPQIVIPIHDGFVKTPEMFSRMIGGGLEGSGIEFAPLIIGEAKEF